MLVRKAQEADHDNLPDGMSIPEELARRKERLQSIAKAKEEIQRRASQRYAQEKEAHEKKMAERRAKAKKSGKKPRGRPPKPPEPGPKKTDQVNLTDEDSRIMPTSGGNFEQSYNAQAGVDMDSLLIVESHLTQQPNDKQQLEPALQNLAALPKALGSPEALVMDSGYFSEGNVNICEAEHITPYIALDREKHNIPLEERFSQPEPLAPHADPVARMKHRLKTPEGKQIYAKRKSTVEPVFGIIKEIMGFRHFLLRGIEAVTGEWDLVCMAYNLKRMHSLKT